MGIRPEEIGQPLSISRKGKPGQIGKLMGAEMGFMLFTKHMQMAKIIDADFRLFVAEGNNYERTAQMMDQRGFAFRTA